MTQRISYVSLLDNLLLCYDSFQKLVIGFIMNTKPSKSLRIEDYRMYKVIDFVSYLGIPAHAAFIPLFFYLGFDFLAYFNFISVAMWVYARQLNKQGKLGLAITLLIAEVIAHAILATIFLGTPSGFQFYLFGLIPFSMFHQRLSTRGFALLAFGIGIAYISSVLIASNMEHHYIEPIFMEVIHYANIIIVISGISISSIYFREASLELEGSLQKSVQEREVLIKEVHHRVKNNMQIIISLLHLQGDKYDNEISEDIINATESRINAMLLVHEKLFQNESISSVDIRSYLDALCDDLQYNLNFPEQMHFNIDCDEIYFNIDKLIPIGLIVNEAITNSCKYADFKIPAEVSIQLHHFNEGYQLIIKDNGQTEPEDYTKEGSIGTDLISGLAKSKLKGNSHIYFDAGTTLEITF